MSFRISAAQAADPVPPPGRIPCDKEGAGEFLNFNSSRPYQASPCGDSPKAVFCGNSLIITETIPGKPVKGDISYITLEPPIDKPPKTYAVDLSDAQFPILGNTEKVTNSQNLADTLDDATKVNEYVSWYLNGVINRAEYPATDPTKDASKIVDFSGPAKKLLPAAIQDAQRIEAIANASIKKSYTDEEGEKIIEEQNHNQIVVCGKEGGSGFWGHVKDILGIGKTNPIACYKDQGTGAQGDVYKLKSWGGILSWDNVIINAAIDGLIRGIKLIYPFIPEAELRKSFSNHWNYKTPPLPWEKDPFTGKNMDSLTYQKYYNEWRGKTCAILPIVNILLCFDNIFVPNKYADLFPYVPLSNTTDKNAKNMIEGVGVKGVGETEIVINDPKYKIIHEPVLYFPHTQEVSDLAETLNKTYVPKKGTDSNPPLETTEKNDLGSCKIANVRSNEGDYLFAEVKPSEVRVDVAGYTVNKMECHLNDYLTKKNGYLTSSCHGEVEISIKMDTKTPYANEIWQNTVAGANSSFRKIYPKVESGAPISCIADLPTSTTVTYTPTEGTNKIIVEGPDKNRVDSPQLYFPHIGSVYDYFLKGIQVALRPKGYGEKITSGAECGNSLCKGPDTIPNLPAASGSCKLSDNPFGIPDNLKKAIEAASQSYKVPPSLMLGIMFGEGAFNDTTFTDEKFVEEQLKGCAKLPNCNPNGDVIQNIVPFFPKYWEKLKDAVKIIDPTREPNACNLLDGIFALAKDLSQNKSGVGSFSGNKCFDITLNSGSANTSGSCSWSVNDSETAIKMWETGTEASCVTRKGSCAGGTSIPFCEFNSKEADCETVGNHSSDTSVNSHNACIWDVYQNNK